MVYFKWNYDIGYGWGKVDIVRLYTKNWFILRYFHSSEVLSLKLGGKR